MKHPLWYYLIHFDSVIKKCMSKCSPKYAFSLEKKHIERIWMEKFGVELNLNNPHTYNEKIQWLKLYDRQPIYTLLADKYRVKEWVAEQLGEDYVIPTIATYTCAEQIDYSSLPDKFVIKCNHDSGSCIICRDKNHFNITSVAINYR